ncbi:unnamed protein product [Clavelina lepadiformis]|uniref:FAM65 N-terminal domain-containing protein n=1 Tax=Clavelina lepadiformis TaxID=159417 RepID=A0ABP0H396_CLALP
MDKTPNPRHMTSFKHSSPTHNGIRSKSHLLTNSPNLKLESSILNPKKKQLAKQLAKAEALNLYHSLDLLDITSDSGKASSCASSTAASTSSADTGQTSSHAERCIPLEYISDYGSSCKLAKKYTRSKSDRFDGRSVFSTGYSWPHSTSAEDSVRSTSSSSAVTCTPPSSRIHTFPANSSLSRSYSVTSHCSLDLTPRRKRFSLFGRHNTDLMSASVSSIEPPVVSPSHVPSPARFTTMYHAVRKGVGEHISVNTAELNVLEVRRKEAGNLNAAQSYDAEKIVKHLGRVVKKLQYQQTQLDELHEAYILQQRYKDGAHKLKSALSSSRVSSRSTRLEIKSDLAQCMETLCTLEQELTGLLGRFHVEMKGLLGFARLRSGDQYEVLIRYGTQKWRLKGTVKSTGEQAWDNTQRTMQPLLTDLINIKVMEIKLLGKHSTVGNISCETKDLFKVEPQDILADLNDTATLKLSLRISWSPYDGYESPCNNQPSTSMFLPNTSRLRSKSVMERPMPSYAASRNRLSSAFARPLSVIYSSSANTNNSNNRRPEISGPISAGGFVVDDESAGSIDENSNKKQSHRFENDSSTDLLESNQGEENAFMAAISKNIERAAAVENQDEMQEIVEEKKEVKTYTEREISISRELVTITHNLNLQLDDYRGRYPDLKRFEIALFDLLERLKVEGVDAIQTDGFSVVSKNSDDSNDSRLQFQRKFGSRALPTTGKLLCDEALIPHLHLAQQLLKDVGVFGPLKVREILALDKLDQQRSALERIMEIAESDDEVVIEAMEEFKGRRALLELWRSSCDGFISFCVTAKTLRLEFLSEFGREVRIKNPDVAEKVFPELVKRIVDRPDLTDIDREIVTLFQVSNYVKSAADVESESLEKLIEKLALEMFITSTLSSGIHHLVLVAIKRISSLLALRISNLRALSHLLLDDDHDVRTAAAAHIKHIATEKLLRDKAILAYVELLESEAKKDRECACIAIGFLSAQQCIPQLAYLYHSDEENDVREAASNVLLSFGDEGKGARDHASSTLLAQTMTQQVTLKNHAARMGTAL